MECMECAIKSCLDDWVCAVACTVVLEDCISAIAITYVFNPISC